jgi:hypothetical protein
LLFCKLQAKLITPIGISTLKWRNLRIMPDLNTAEILWIWNLFALADN